MDIHPAHTFAEVLLEALMLTGFVLVIMLVVEYVNVLTRGVSHGRLTKHRWQQYLLAAVLGGMPGCLGSFAVVSMYSHGVMTIGAVVTAMIATTGDESFVMLATMPRKAMLLMGALTLLGLIAGPVVDAVVARLPSRKDPACDHGLELHGTEDDGLFEWQGVMHQWRSCTAARGLLVSGLVFFTILILSQHGEHGWEWMTGLVVSLVALFIVATVPDHFLEEHLWRHVARRHALRVTLWTVGTLVAFHFVPLENAQLLAWLKTGPGQWAALVLACVIGLIPQSGPHIPFVIAYTESAIPLGVLVASMLVQDGHGMLPMLAHSREAVLRIKLLKIVLAVLIGGTMIRYG